MHDKSCPTLSNKTHASFMREQCLKECLKGYHFPSFGSELLPGMYSMPIHAIPPYNHLLKAAVDIILHNDYSLRVLHVPGEQNLVADALLHIHSSITL
jgi:hypothetical protein